MAIQSIENNRPIQIIFDLVGSAQCWLYWKDVSSSSAGMNRVSIYLFEECGFVEYVFENIRISALYKVMQLDKLTSGRNCRVIRVKEPGDQFISHLSGRKGGDNG
jgi:hypothetical protein